MEVLYLMGRNCMNTYTRMGHNNIKVSKHCRTTLQFDLHFTVDLHLLPQQSRYVIYAIFLNCLIQKGVKRQTKAKTSANEHRLAASTPECCQISNTGVLTVQGRTYCSSILSFGHLPTGDASGQADFSTAVLVFYCTMSTVWIFR